MSCGNDKKPNDISGSGVSFWIEMIPAWARGFVAAGFVFTIWSVFTGFDLGNIMNKYADATLEQNQMQFEAQLELQKLQYEATESSNDKLDSLISSVVDVTKRMDEQTQLTQDIIRRIGKNEKTLTMLVDWACNHEKSEQPGYCTAIAEGGR